MVHPNGARTPGVPASNQGFGGRAARRGRARFTASDRTGQRELQGLGPSGGVLRRTRNKALFALIERDLSARADLREVMAAMTALAELAIREALEFSTRELALIHGVPVAASSGKPQDLIVVGMGKLGGGELNVSSDIDLIFLYGESGETASPDETPVRPVSNHEFFDLLGRRLIAILSEATADGFVFRVDMGLRPNGSSGPLAASFTMLEEYFVTQGRDWERFAWIKARIVSRPVLSGISAVEWAAQLQAIDRPFVYRRYLDFGAIAALRALHGQIRAEVVRQETKAARHRFWRSHRLLVRST